MKLTNPLTAVKPALRAGLRWTLWSPTRAILVGGAAAMVIVLGTATYLLTSANDFIVTVNEKKAALEAIKAAGRPTPTSTSSAAATTTTGASPTSTTPPAPGALPAEASPATAKVIDLTTRQFLAAWSAGPTATSDGAWIAGLEKWTDPSLLDLFRLTDRRQVPAGAKLTAVGAPVVVEGTARVSTQVAGVGALDVTLIADGDRWLVSELTPPDGHEQ